MTSDTSATYRSTSDSASMATLGSTRAEAPGMPGTAGARSADDLYLMRLAGPKYPPHAIDGPLFEPIDMAGLAAGIVITLGPLAAVALGFGPL